MSAGRAAVGASTAEAGSQVCYRSLKRDYRDVQRKRPDSRTGTAFGRESTVVLSTASSPKCSRPIRRNVKELVSARDDPTALKARR